MDWVTALCTSTGCTIDGAAATLNPLNNWIEKWSKHNLGTIMNINTPQNASAVVNVMSQYSLNPEEQRVMRTLEKSLEVMENAWKDPQHGTSSYTRRVQNIKDKMGMEDMEGAWAESQQFQKDAHSNRDRFQTEEIWSPETMDSEIQSIQLLNAAGEIDEVYGPDEDTYQILENLLKKGVDPNIINNNVSDYPAIVLAILSVDESEEYDDDDEDLSEMIENQVYDKVSLLIEYGAQIPKKAIDEARKKGLKRVEKLLLSSIGRSGGKTAWGNVRGDKPSRLFGNSYSFYY